MEERVAVRAMQPADAERVAEMAAALSAHEGQPPPPFGAAEVLRYGFGAEKRFDGLVARLAGETVGYALYFDSFNVGLGTPGLHMIDLYVEPRARARGVGRALVAAVAAEALRRGGAWVVWQSLPSNALALAFYRRIGGRQYQAADFELAGEALSELAALA